MNANVSDGQVQGTLIQIGNLNGSVDLGQPEPRGVRLLPAATSVFQNRTADLAVLDDWLSAAQAGGSRLWNITGASGVGKTTLALVWINANRHRFGHAQIAMECGGAPDDSRGRGIEEVCDRYFALTGLVTEGHALHTPAAKIELFRSLVEERSAVLLLDDVQSAAQVQPFLSSVPGLLVIATSRGPLAGLAQNRPRRLHLEPLLEESLAALFADILDEDRTAAEPGAFAELLRLCGGLPLVAGHAAGLLYDRPELAIGDLVGRMAERGRLSALEDGNDDVMVRPSSVFDVSYAELGEQAAEVYRAIGLHPTRDFDSTLIAALFPDSAPEAARSLADLLGRGLVKRDRRGRCLMDDLTYEHAAALARRITGPGERRRIQARTFDYYLYCAVAADSRLSQRWRLSPLYDQQPPCPVPDFAAPHRPDDERRPGTAPTPAQWFDDNLAAIMSCMERAGRIWDGSPARPGYRWQMAEATNAYFTASGRGDERATILAWAEDDADACGDPDAQARVQAQWGEMLLGQARVDEAEGRLGRSLAAAEAGTDPRAVGAALEWLGITERRRGRAREALAYFDRSRPFLDPHRPRSHALHHTHRADAYAVLGETESALECYSAAMERFRELARTGRRDDANEGKVLMGQGELLSAERPRQARALFEEALTRFRAAGRPYQEAKALEALGGLDGDTATGREHRRAALELYTRIGNRRAADRVRDALGPD